MILTPHETFAILNSLPLLQQTMVILDAATGLRYSEVAGLRWGDCDWRSNRINIRRTWIRGKVGLPKTRKSKAPVAMAPLLAHYLCAWRSQSVFAADTDWIFASHKTKGRSPRVGNMLASDYLRPAAVKVGGRQSPLRTCSTRRERKPLSCITGTKMGMRCAASGSTTFGILWRRF